MEVGPLSEGSVGDDGERVSWIWNRYQKVLDEMMRNESIVDGIAFKWFWSGCNDIGQSHTRTI